MKIINFKAIDKINLTTTMDVTLQLNHIDTFDIEEVKNAITIAFYGVYIKDNGQGLDWRDVFQKDLHILLRHLAVKQKKYDIEKEVEILAHEANMIDLLDKKFNFYFQINDTNTPN